MLKALIKEFVFSYIKNCLFDTFKTSKVYRCVSILSYIFVKEKKVTGSKTKRKIF